MERIAGFEIHPAASAFPLMPEAELEQLAKDIATRGQDLPIVLHQGQVLDGRNRLLACERAGVPPKTVEWDGRGGSPTAFAVGANIHRRHLTESQRAMLAAEFEPLFAEEARQRQVANLRKGAETPVTAPGREREAKGTAAAQAASAVGSAERSVQRAKAVAKQAPKLAEQVKQGEVTLKQAEKQIRTREQLKQVKAYRPPEGKFPVIACDPPWPFEDELEGDGARGGLPYPPMTLEEICAFPVPADKDCILFLWVTNAHLVDGSALRVLQAWGFEPKTLITWVKDRMGVGRWVRNITEHVVVAVKGKPTVTLKNQTTAISAPRRAHSEKPAEAFELFESLCPAEPKLELWARAERAGWVTSGAEAPAPRGLPECKAGCGTRVLGGGSGLCRKCALAESRAQKHRAKGDGPIRWKLTKDGGATGRGVVSGTRFTVERHKTLSESWKAKGYGEWSYGWEALGGGGTPFKSLEEAQAAAEENERGRARSKQHRKRNEKRTRRSA